MPPLLTAIVASAALGALVGLIRQWRDQVEQPAPAGFGGVRTYAFWAMLGCLGAFAAEKTSALFLAVLIAVVGAQQIVARANALKGARPGGTTFAATLLTLLAGSLTYWRESAAAVLVAGLTLVLVGSKPALHGWTRAFTRGDMRAVIQFAAITGVILPLAPNENLGPFEAFNPFSIWLMVVLISGLGFAGYVVMRIFGARTGVLLTSFFGGLASSTATTLAFSRRSHDARDVSAHFELAVIVACTVMLPRVLGLAAVISAPFAARLVTPAAAMAVPGVLFVAWTWWWRRPDAREDELLPLANPLGLGTALKFGALYAAIMFLVKAAAAQGWAAGLLPLSFASGFAGVDAIILSLAHSFAGEGGWRDLAVRAAVLALIGNTLLKAGIVLATGSAGVKRWTLLVLGATAAVGAVWLFFPVNLVSSVAP